MFNIIDYNTWDRREIYERFGEKNNCAYYITIQMDGTKLLKKIKENGIRLYPTMIYLFSKVANSDKNYRFYKNDDGKIGFFDRVDPLYTVMRKTGLFTHKVTIYNNNFKTFYSDFLLDEKTAIDCDKLYCDEPLQENLLCISVTSTLHFTSMSFNTPMSPDGANSYIPFSVIGKYIEENGKILLPVCTEFSHTINDGAHAEKFYKLLQEEMDNFCLDGGIN